LLRFIVSSRFDVDVVDPPYYDVLPFRNPQAPPDAFDGIVEGRMHFAGVFAILDATNAETIGLASAEHLPWSVIKFAKVLNALPLLGNPEGASHGDA